MNPYPFEALNHFTTPCSLANFLLLVQVYCYLLGVTPVGAAKKPAAAGFRSPTGLQNPQTRAICCHKTPAGVQRGWPTGEQRHASAQPKLAIAALSSDWTSKTVNNLVICSKSCTL